MAQMERRVGKVLFREMLALHFSPNRPEAAARRRPVGGLPHDGPGGAGDRARAGRGETYPEADPLRTAQFFMLGLYAVLITSHDHSRAARAEILDNFVATVLRSVEAR